MMKSEKEKAMTKQLQSQIKILATFVGIFWVVELVDLFVFHGYLNNFGIMPRSVIGLRGILFAPFLHGNLAHLLANTLPFVILGWLVMVQETSDFWIVTALTTLVGGLGVWLFAAPGSIHIGASILIFGYFGFLLFRGYFQRNLPSIALSLLVVFLYGSLVWGILPTQAGISWQGHLFGFLGGVLAAKAIAREKAVEAREMNRREKW